MKRNYEEKIQTDVNTIFTLMTRRVDENQMNLLHDAYGFAAFAHKTNCASRVNPISVILLP